MNSKNLFITILILIIINSSNALSHLEEKKLYLIIGSRTFTATLDSNEAVTSLKGLLPLQIKMLDDGKIAKSHKFSSSLKYVSRGMKGIKQNEEIIGEAQAGDIVMYESQYLTIFYDKFNSNQKFVKIGHVDVEGEDMEELKDALGKNDVEILWILCNPENDDCKVPFSSYFVVDLHFLTWKVLSFLCFLFL